MSRLTTKEYRPTNSIKQMHENVLLAMWDKLKHYEDLADEERLIELPCLPDEPVWEAHKYYPPRLTMYCSYAHILESMEAGYCIGYTKAEAEAKLEAKLAELKEGE